MLNQCQFIGRLGADPEIRRMQNGDPVVNIRLAVAEKWKNKDGERQEKTEWVSVVIFNEALTKFAESYIKKGSTVFVSGKLQTREWQDKDGQKRYFTEIVLQKYRGELVILDSKRGNDDAGDDALPKARASGKADPASELDDDLPF